MECPPLITEKKLKESACDMADILLELVFLYNDAPVTPSERLGFICKKVDALRARSAVVLFAGDDVIGRA